MNVLQNVDRIINGPHCISIYTGVPYLLVLTQLGPSTLAVPDQLSNGGDKNMGHSPAQSGTDFWAHVHH